MHSFKCANLASFKPGDSLELDKAESSHLFKTLRAAPGFELALMDGAGLQAKAKALPGRRIEILSIEKAEMPARRIHLFIAPPRRQKMDQILRQATELGVWTIRPMLCARSVSTPDEDSVAGRWEDVIMEACKQSGNPFAPATQAPMPFAAALAQAGKDCVCSYFGAVVEGSANELPSEDGDFGWFVGPEGGFSQEEEDALLAAKLKPLHIGRCTLRVETAAICGLAVLSCKES